MVDAPALVGEPVPLDTVGVSDPAAPATGTSPAHVSRRRFTRAAVIGIAVVTIPYLWILWDLWTGSPNPLRVVSPSNFYDLQARAMFSGHLYVPNGALGIEAFVHGWPRLHLLRHLPVAHTDADPGGHPPLRHPAHRTVDAGRLAVSPVSSARC